MTILLSIDFCKRLICFEFWILNLFRISYLVLAYPGKDIINHHRERRIDVFFRKR